jgi:RNA polymerase sigma factor (sigma-70 family)
MTRDDIILSCIPIVDNLVRKYNNHHSDEDLQSIGMIAVVECVDRSLSDGLDDLNQIQARCNTWARNAILDDIYKEKIKYADDTSAIDYMETETDLYETIKNVESVLTPRQNEVFQLLVQGYSPKQVQDTLGIAKCTITEHIRNIKDKIRGLE